MTSWLEDIAEFKRTGRNAYNEAFKSALRENLHAERPPSNGSRVYGHLPSEPGQPPPIANDGPTSAAKMYQPMRPPEPLKLKPTKSLGWLPERRLGNDPTLTGGDRPTTGLYSNFDGGDD